jgi:hypothetical protein
MKHSLQLAAAAVLISLASITQANSITYNFDTVFSSGAVAPVGGSPYMTAVFDDGGTPGSVTLTMTVASTAGAAYVDDVYLNFDSALNLALLNFTYAGTTGPATGSQGDNGIFTGIDAYQADGDGKYDIEMNFPPPPGTASARWAAGEVVVYNITSTQAITAGSFAFLSAPGGNAGGPFYAAAHFQNTGPSGGNSAWVGVSTVPLPAAAWLFGSGFIGLLGSAIRRPRQ